jgi:hypothetical protein
MMVPIIDAVAMMLRRFVRGRSPFAPDREHLHHIFLLAGYTVNQTVAILAGAGVFGVGVGLAATYWDWPDLLVAGAFLGMGLLYFWLIMHAWRVMRFLHRSICRRRGAADRRSQEDRRRGASAAYHGPERRSGHDRRQLIARRQSDLARYRTHRAGYRAAQPMAARISSTQAHDRAARGQTGPGWR